MPNPQAPSICDNASIRSQSQPSSYYNTKCSTDDPFDHNLNSKDAMSGGPSNKMHQTSSRLLRMTDDERPYTKDLKDLFSTLVVSLPLGPHRVRFTKMDHTFTSEEAIDNLGSLKFSQSNRMPDPKDLARIVTTTTTTTFSMAKEMARTVCQRFLDARLIEPADGRPTLSFALKNVVWHLTPKGINVLNRFCSRNGIVAEHVRPILDKDSMQLVEVERDTVTDRFFQDRGTIEVIFKRFVGRDGPNIKNSTTASDSDSLSDYQSGLVGVKMAADRKFADKHVKNSFTGKAASDWLLDCCSTIDRSETLQIAETFVRSALMCCVAPDKMYQSQNPNATFLPTKASIYALTERGQRLCGWLNKTDSTSSDSSRDKNKATRPPPGGNNNRLNVILQDPALRLLFREFLRKSLCEENLSFYLDVKEFTGTYRALEENHAFARLDAVRETLAAAYGKSSSNCSRHLEFYVACADTWQQDCTTPSWLQDLPAS
jgi:GTPase-activating protein SST2